MREFLLIQSLQCLLSTRQLKCMNVLVYARACDRACMRFRSDKLFAWIHIQMRMFVLVFETANQCFVFVVVLVKLTHIFCYLGSCKISLSNITYVKKQQQQNKTNKQTNNKTKQNKQTTTKQNKTNKQNKTKQKINKFK